jgi:hypothetical protein
LVVGLLGLGFRFRVRQHLEFMQSTFEEQDVERSMADAMRAAGLGLEIGFRISGLRFRFGD